MILHAKQLNHGRSEIWLDEGPHRDIATNAVVWAVRKFAADKYDGFYALLHQSVGTIASVEATPEIVADLGLA